MTHCNDQLIDQLLTQAEQEGRCLIPPSTAIRKALLRRTGDMVVSPMPGDYSRVKCAGMSSTGRSVIARLFAPLRSSTPFGRSARFRQPACWGSRSRGDT